MDALVINETIHEITVQAYPHDDISVPQTPVQYTYIMPTPIADYMV